LESDVEDSIGYRKTQPISQVPIKRSRTWGNPEQRRGRSGEMESSDQRCKVKKSQGLQAVRNEEGNMGPIGGGGRPEIEKEVTCVTVWA